MSNIGDLDKKLARQKWLDTPVKPFIDKLLPVEPFNYELIPEPLRPWIKNTAERMDNSAPDFVAIGCLVAIAGLIGGRLLMQPKRKDSWCLPVTLWGLCIGPPSAKKSPPLKGVMSIINDLQRDVIDPTYEGKIIELEADMMEYDSKLKAMKKDLDNFYNGKENDDSRSIDTIKRDIKILLEKKPPLLKKRKLVSNDATIEALIVTMSAASKGMMSFRDEMSGWMSKLNKDEYQYEKATILEMFDGYKNKFTVDRISRDGPELEHTILSILGGIQPAKYEPILRSRREGGGDDGFVERFQLAVYPDVQVKATDIARDEEAYNCALTLFKDLVDLVSDEESPVYRFDDEAYAVYWPWYQELTERINNETNSWQAILGKYPALVARLALIFHMIDGGHGTQVGIRSLLTALAWSDYLQSHAARILALGDDPFYSAKKLLRKLSEKRHLPNPFTATDFANKKWGGLVTPVERKQALNELESRGFLRAEEEKSKEVQTKEVKTNDKSVTNYYIHNEVFGK